MTPTGEGAYATFLKTLCDFASIHLPKTCNKLQDRKEIAPKTKKLKKGVAVAFTPSNLMYSTSTDPQGETPCPANP